MSWVTAFRWCGGSMYSEEVQRVVRHLNTMGYRAVIGEYHWITNLFDSQGNEVWHARTGRDHDAQFQSVRDALGPTACELMDAFSRRDAVIDDPLIRESKLKVGTATKLPLPR